jgi:CNT family concentrative nucleoside transporter
MLFAAIILGAPALSYFSMMVFLALIIVYIFKDEVNAGFLAGNQVFSAVGVILLAVLSAVIFYFLSLAGALGWVWWILLLAIIVKAIIKVSHYQKHLVAGLLTSGYIWLFTHDFTGEKIFAVISQKVERFLSLSDLGAEFLFGNLALKKHFFPGSDSWPGFGFQFGFSVLPVIIFFAAFMSILYHLGVMQKIIRWMARFMQWTMGTSGAETLSCSANIFVGQTEAPLLIRPFLNDMTLSELLTVMVGGFATIAGGVLAGFIAMGISAGHLIAASVMSAPAALVVAKIIFPETQLSKTSGDVDLPKDLIESTNLLDAASRGVTDGLKLAVNVGAMLIAFIAIIGFIDSVLSIFDRLIDGNLFKGSYQNYATVSGFTPVTGEYNGIFPGSLKTLFGTILSPLAWLMGVSWQYAGEVGNLLGIKLALTEFVAYGTLAELKNMGAIDEKAIVISTYALCGFANFASIGIQIGGISALVPNRRSDLSKIALKAMFGGAIASWITASIAGILL